MLNEKMLRYKVMEFHRQLTRNGQYIAAKRVLGFLQKEKIALGLDDVDWFLEKSFEKLGCKISYTGRYYTACAYLKGA